MQCNSEQLFNTKEMAAGKPRVITF